MARHDFISGLTSSNAPGEKVYNAAVILYPESMYDDWQNRLQAFDIPCAYCIHDKDSLADGETDRKIHVHVYMRFDQNTTLRYIKRLVETLCDKSKLQSDGSSVTSCATPVCKINNPRSKYDYLIHNTDAAKKDHKYQYDPKERIEINNFDIGKYETLTEEEKSAALDEIIDFILNLHIINFGQLKRELCEICEPTENNPDNTKWDNWKELIKSYHAYLARYILGNYGEAKDDLKSRIEKLEHENASLNLKLGCHKE